MENQNNSLQKVKKILLIILIGTLLFNLVLLSLVVLLDGKIWFGIFWAVLVSGFYCFFGLLSYLVLLLKQPKGQQINDESKGKLLGILVLFLGGIGFAFFNLIVIILTNL